MLPRLCWHPALTRLQKRERHQNLLQMARNSRVYLKQSTISMRCIWVRAVQFISLYHNICHVKAKTQYITIHRETSYSACLRKVPSQWSAAPLIRIHLHHPGRIDSPSLPSALASHGLYCPAVSLAVHIGTFR